MKIITAIGFFYIIFALSVLYNQEAEHLFISLISPIFWNVGVIYLYIYLLAPLLIILAFTIKGTTASRVLMVFAVCFLCSMLMLNQAIELIYEPNLNVTKLYSFLIAVSIATLLFIGLKYILISNELVLYVAFVLLSVMLAVTPYTFHLLDSIANTSK